MLPQPFLDRLRQDFPADFSSVEPDDLKTYGADWTRVYTPKPSIVVFPRSGPEVARVLKLCNEHSVRVVPSGGRTGLAGGAVARAGELVLSLERMRALGEVDRVGATVRVQAGAVTEAVHEHVKAHGLTWPIDFASKGSSQIGGNISTNAGGVRVIRYGSTRNWVLGLQVATMAGELLELNGALEKNNTGMDLRQLFIGSEGTLGIITEATLKLAPLPGTAAVLLFGLESMSAVLELLAKVRSGGFLVNAFECFSNLCLKRVELHRKLGDPLDEEAAWYALVELEPRSDDELENWLEAVLLSGLTVTGTMAQDGSQARRLWEYREAIAESLFATGLPHKNDIALPVAALADFCSEFERVFEQQYPGWEVCIFGHIGDGNLHINVMKPEDLSKDDFLAKTKQADRALFELVRLHQGSISAEHGIGLLKRDYLGYSRSPAELELLKAVKRVFDPNNLLNPGKIFELPD